MIDGQTILVALLILCALLYVLRRASRRLRSFGARGGGATCETGCGKCGAQSAAAAHPTSKRA